MNAESDPLVSEWKSYATNPKLNLIEKCLKLAQILEYPTLDIEKSQQILDFTVATLQEMY